ncbi:MAG: chorismate synthase [Candidatus Melainabacteria bacterium]|nr:chorismate synthase [Candidatus Melainabacteria bacterium]
MRFLTAGESHGKGLTVLIDNFPAGVPIDWALVNQDLSRRQQGYGRGGRQKLEKDKADCLSGVRFEKTTGAPIALFIENRDHANWETVMASEGSAGEAAASKRFVRPRPGHADLAGYYKYNLNDLRDALERASARETAARVAAGGFAKALLRAVGMDLASHVSSLGTISVPEASIPDSLAAIRSRAEANDLRCVADDSVLAAMRQAVDDARMAGTTLGGELEVQVVPVIPGLGSYTQWDRRLDGLLAQAVMSIQAVKSVTIGDGNQGATLAGHEFHDSIHPHTPDASGRTTLKRGSNRSGGLEGGVTTGAPLIVRATMKPIATLRVPLDSINLETGTPEPAHFERSDVTAVPACAVVAEAMVAVVLAQAVLEKFGHDNLTDIQQAINAYQERLHYPPATIH